MGLEALLTLAILALVLGLLVFSRAPPDAVLVGGVTLLLLGGVIDTHDALHGMANEGVVTIAVLFVVAAGLRETGAMDALSGRMLGRPKTLSGAQARLLFPVGLLSAFMNNTPLVAMMMPVVSDWARRLKFSPSKLLLPLSYASILGGACTLVGTSTNLIVNGWLIEETGRASLGMFEIGKVGLPIAFMGAAYILIGARWLLPARDRVLDPGEDPRQYTVEVLVDEDGPLVNKTIEAAGLRHLSGLYLVEIEREQQVLAAVSPNVALKGGDRLVFVGVVASVVDLQKIRGLSLAGDQVYKLDTPRNNRLLVEAVVSNSSPLVNQTIREGRFRTHYKAVVLAVGRNGERLEGKIGDIRLRAGDTLLIEARAGFALEQRDSRDFYLVSDVVGTRPPSHDRAGVSLAILAGMVALVATGSLSMLKASMLAAGLMFITGCCRASVARAAVDWQVLVVIAASLGLGKGIQRSGLDVVMADGLVAAVGSSPTMALAAVFTVTAVLAGVVTAKAAAVLLLPVALGLSQTIGVDFMPFVIAIMVAASTTVATPIGYPTNLMVMGPGGYRFSDYMRFGGPLTVLIGVMSVLLIPVFWPF